MARIGHLAGMVKVSEIKDRKSLEAWLLDRLGDETKKFAITIAHRATMRVLPVYWLWAVQNPHLFASPNFALPELRCAIIASVAQKLPTYELKKAAVSAVRLLEQNAADAVGIITFEDISRCLARAAYVVNDDSAFSTIAAKAVELTSFADHKWKHINNDCAALEGGNSLRNTPLFREKMNPFQEDWDAVRTSLSPDWSFWINWYQDALEGREPNWDMLCEIALIPDEDWEKGPEHINNEVIAEIVEKYAKKRESETSATDAAMPSKAEQKTIAQKVADNREALAFSLAGVLEQIAEYRERVRKLNSLEPEYKEGLLDFLDRLSKQLSDLLGELPDEGEVVSEEKSANLVLWWRKYKVIFRGKAKAYLTADNIAEATVPAGIILGCTGIGAIFGPVGATAGGIVGSLITGQIKPGKAAGELMKDLDAPDIGV